VHHAHPLNLRRFIRQHYNYGRGAYDFYHRCYKGKLRVEPPAFYLGLLRQPRSESLGWRTAPVIFLLALSQVANAAGYLRGARPRGSRERSSRLARLRHYTTPGLLTGIRLRNWGRLLRDNQFRVSPRFWGRAALISLHSLLNSSVGAIEELVFGRKVDAARVLPPLFILGTSRSGTSYLYNLLSLDSRFAFPNLFQVQYPHIFLLTERLLPKLLTRFLPRTREQDGVRVGWQSPGEDEVALSAISLRSGLLGFIFPRSFDRYSRYTTFEEVSQADVADWKAAILRLFKKLTLKYGRPLLVKSPIHTGRIRLLTELFPDARFIHIHRHPYDVLESQRDTFRAVLPKWQLQDVDLEDADEIVFREYREICRAFFDQRSSIAEGGLYEMRFEEFEREPITELERAYMSLGLGDFETVRAAMRSYVASERDYQKGAHPELPPVLKERLLQECSQSFEEWGYQPQ
jgi:hypothetical protein